MTDRGSQRAEALRLEGDACQHLARLDIAFAADEVNPRDERLRRWEAARDWLQRRFDVLVVMRERGTLAASDVRLLDDTSAEIETCSAAIDSLSRSDNAADGISP